MNDLIKRFDSEEDSSATSSQLGSLCFGAFLASAVLTIYTVLKLLGNVLVTATPYLAGGALFLTLCTVFLSTLASLRSMRKGARKTFAVADTYAALSVISVMGFYIAACVQTFQPGGNPGQYWTTGTVTALSFAALFACGKYGAELFRAGNSK